MTANAENAGNEKTDVPDKICTPSEDGVAKYTNAGQTEDFEKEMAGCTVYVGDLTLGLGAGFDLDVLKNLKTIDGKLVLGGTEDARGEGWKGLRNLVSVGELSFATPVATANAHDLKSLGEVKGLLKIHWITEDTDLGLLKQNNVSFQGIHLSGVGLKDERDLSFVKGDLSYLSISATSLTTLDGLGEIENIRGELIVEGNSELVSIEKLRGVDTIEVGAAVLRNRKLDPCHIEDVLSDINVEGKVRAEGNLRGEPCM